VTERARDRRERAEPDGAPTPAKEERPPRPRRPVGVELAAAIMIVTGVISTLTSIEAAMTFAAEGRADEPLAVASVAFGVATVILGLLVRVGRAWLVAVNVAAVAGFLELISGTAEGWLFGALDVVVVVLLMIDRPWFTGPDADDEAGEGGA
jgi:hypothetical protein